MRNLRNVGRNSDVKGSVEYLKNIEYGVRFRAEKEREMLEVFWLQTY